MAACAGCDTEFSVYKDRQHIRKAEGNGNNILGGLGEFCAAFFHVPGIGSTTRMKCLDEKDCIIARKDKGAEQNAQPTSAVAFVKYESESGDVLFLRRYTNCYTQKMHAEEFFRRDINPKISKGRLIKAIYKENTVKKITMFITMQPCHLSTLNTGGTHGGQSCCRMIVEAIAGLPDDVQICIKPTHLCQAGWEKKGNRYDKCIDNAELGLKALRSIRERVEVLAMEPKDWTFLSGHVAESITEEALGRREQLDEETEIKPRL